MMSYLPYVEKILRRHFSEFYTCINQIPSNKNPKLIHRLRVSYRRLQNARRVFKDAADLAYFKKWKKETKKLLKVSGKARDLDVQITFLKKRIRSLKHPSEKTQLRKVMLACAGKRAEMQARLIKEIQTFQKNNLKKKFEKGIINKNWCKKYDTARYLSSVGQRNLLKRIKKILIWECYVVDGSKTKEHHQMRIRIKHLRYSLEDFRNFYGPDTKKIIEKMIEIQSLLGVMHDFDVWIEFFDSLLKKDQQAPGKKNAIKDTLTFCRTSRSKAYKNFAFLWQQLKSDHFWKNLENFISNKKIT